MPGNAQGDRNDNGMTIYYSYIYVYVTVMGSTSGLRGADMIKYKHKQTHMCNRYLLTNTYIYIYWSMQQGIHTHLHGRKHTPGKR